MPINRRHLLQSLAALPILSATSPRLALSETTATPHDEFFFEGIYLNAAYTHPMGRTALAAAEKYFKLRSTDAGHHWPSVNPRNEAVAAFARLIHAAPEEIAVVPSTMQGENQVCQSLGIGPGAGVLTDSQHYDASLSMYGEMQKLGTPVSVVTAHNGRIDMNEVERAFTPKTRLVAISMISSISGFEYDLKALSELAHSRGALVYADIIQAVGAVPIDIKATGVDFACAGCYKFLMGDFGAAFLYVRPELLPQLHRSMWGWRQTMDEHQQRNRFDPPCPPLGAWKMREDVSGIFEVSTPAWNSLAVATASIGYIEKLGVEQIAAHRQPLLKRLRAGMTARGFESLTPEDSTGPLLCMARPGTEKLLRTSFEQARIITSLYPNYLRLSLSVYNNESDVEAVLGAVDEALKKQRS